MQVGFSSKKLQKLCNSEKEMKKKYDQRMAKVLQQRLAEIAAAKTLEDMGHLPVARCHELTQNRKG